MSVDAARMLTAETLLGWYDGHARTLPWRMPPGAGATPDPYRVWLSEIMLQQTTTAAVAPYFARFTARWPDVAALAAVDDAELMAAWAGLGYYARARNLLACARAVMRDHGGRFPDDEATLRALPGVGRYTAAAIAAIAFDRNAVVVDGNVERVVSRLFALDEALPGARRTLHTLAATLTPAHRAGDYAQAMMDLGATICTPRSPRCLPCPLRAGCEGHAAGGPERFPLRTPKAVKPQRHGIAYWLEADGKVLLVRRPPRGLLGGMRALPGGAWDGTEAPPIDADWRSIGAVRHVFTHFALTLDIQAATLAKPEATPDGEWWPIAALAEAGLPTLYARAATLGVAATNREAIAA